MLRAIFHFLNVKFVYSVDKRPPLSVAQDRSLEREGEAENFKNKSRFTSKLTIIYINQKCSMGVGLMHILKTLNLNGVWRWNPQHLTIFGINY